MGRKVRPAAAARVQPKEMGSLLMGFFFRHSRDSDETGHDARGSVSARLQKSGAHGLLRASLAPQGTSYLMRKLSLVRLVPFISSRIHTGVMPLPVHFSDLFFLD